MIINILCCLGFYLFITIFMLLTYIFIFFNNLINFKMNIKKLQKIKKIFYAKLGAFLFKFVFWISIEVEGRKILRELNLKKDKFIIISNHISFIDSFILLNLINDFKDLDKIYIIGMHKIIEWPIVGYVLKNTGMIFIKFLKSNNNENKYSSESVLELKNNCIELLNNGNSLMLFPEGRCNKNPLELNQIRGGAYEFQKETNTPIKIIAMKGNNKIWPYNGYPTGYGKIKIKIFINNFLFKNIYEYRMIIKKSIEDWLNNDENI